MLLTPDKTHCNLIAEREPRLHLRSLFPQPRCRGLTESFKPLCFSPTASSSGCGLPDQWLDCLGDVPLPLLSQMKLTPSPGQEPRLLRELKEVAETRQELLEFVSPNEKSNQVTTATPSREAMETKLMVWGSRFHWEGSCPCPRRVLGVPAMKPHGMRWLCCVPKAVEIQVLGTGEQGLEDGPTAGRGVRQSSRW